MLGRTIFAATLFALAQFAVATPPGCLLGAVNEYSDPSDVKSICKSKDLSSKVASFCGDDAEAAMEAIADMCNDAGVEVSTDISSATSSSSHATKTSSASGHYATGTAGSTLVMYPTGSGSNSTAPVATGVPKPTDMASGTASAGMPESTGAAGKMEIGIAAIVAGLMAVAL